MVWPFIHQIIPPSPLRTETKGAISEWMRVKYLHAHVHKRGSVLATVMIEGVVGMLGNALVLGTVFPNLVHKNRKKCLPDTLRLRNSKQQIIHNISRRGWPQFPGLVL